MGLKKTASGILMTCDIHADRSGLTIVEAYLDGLMSLSVGTKIQSSVPISVGGKPVKRVTRARLVEVSLVREAAFKGTGATLEPVSGLSLAKSIDQLRQMVHSCA